MRRLATLFVILLLALPAAAAGPALRPAGHITSQTSTHVVAAVAGKRVSIYTALICVDFNGVTTGLALKDTGGTNLIGTNVVFVLAPGQCLALERSGNPYFNVVSAGLGLDLVTTVGNGPVEYYFEVVQE